MSDFPAAPPPTGIPGATPATFGQRLVALLIDFGLIIAMYIPLIVVVAILGRISGILGLLAALVLYLAGFVAALYYYIGNIGSTGQTPGKRLQGVQVVNDDGTNLGLGGAAIRYIVSAISNSIVCGLPVGSLWMLFDAEDKTLYDKILNNQAVQVEKGELLPIFPDGNPI